MRSKSLSQVSIPGEFPYYFPYTWVGLGGWMAACGSREKGAIARVRLLKTFMSTVLEARMKEQSTLHPTTMRVRLHQMPFYGSFSAQPPSELELKHVVLWIPYPHAKQRAGTSHVPVHSRLWSALPMLLFHQANHCESVSTSWLLCCSLGMTVTCPPLSFACAVCLV